MYFLLFNLSLYMSGRYMHDLLNKQRCNNVTSCILYVVCGVFLCNMDDVDYITWHNQDENDAEIHFIYSHFMLNVHFDVSLHLYMNIIPNTK